jgi:hypothetical protein
VESALQELEYAQLRLQLVSPEPVLQVARRTLGIASRVAAEASAGTGAKRAKYFSALSDPAMYRVISADLEGRSAHELDAMAQEISSRLPVPTDDW